MLLYYIIFFIGCFSNISADKSATIDKIIKDVFTDYKKSIRPPGSITSSGVKVGISLIPLYMHINSETSTLSSHAWFVMNWQDNRLKWVPSNYDNISVVHIGPDKIWKPDIMVFNSVKHYDFEPTDVSLVSSGAVWWYPPGNIETNCALDFTYWPWDYQKCKIVIGSWTQTGWDIDVTTLGMGNTTAVDTRNFVPGAWEIVSGVQKRNVMTEYGDDGEYVELQVTFLLKRRSFLDKKVAILPLLVCCCMILAVFWIHPSSSNRLRLNIAACVLLIITVLALRTILPTAGGQIPMIVMMGSGLVVLAIGQLILILCLFNLVARVDSPPGLVMSPLQMLSNILCLGNIPLIGQVPASVVPPWAQSQNSGDTEALTPELPKLKGWNLIAQALDRIMFILYLCIIFLFLVSYIGAANADINSKTP